MRAHFQIETEIATSTSVEAEFAELKNRAFKGQLPMKADKFVHEHLDYIDGRIKLILCQKDVSSTDYKQQNNITHDYSSASSIEIETENSIEICSYSDINSDVNCNIPKDQLHCNIREN